MKQFVDNLKKFISSCLLDPSLVIRRFMELQLFLVVVTCFLKNSSVNFQTSFPKHTLCSPFYALSQPENIIVPRCMWSMSYPSGFPRGEIIVDFFQLCMYWMTNIVRLTTARVFRSFTKGSFNTTLSGISVVKSLVERYVT